MTSRRPFKHHEQRLSRALQYEPGHVGGRVASAQPVNRRDGTIRRGHSVGAAGAAVATPPIGGIAYDSPDVLWDDPVIPYFGTPPPGGTAYDSPGVLWDDPAAPYDMP